MVNLHSLRNQILSLARLPFRHARSGCDRTNAACRVPTADTARVDEFIGPKDVAVPLSSVHYAA